MLRKHIKKNNELDELKRTPGNKSSFVFVLVRCLKLSVLFENQYFLFIVFQVTRLHTLPGPIV